MPDGGIAASYDKIHMFDVDLPSGESYRESRRFRPGSEARVVDLPWGRLGMTICYDLRFPELYRKLVERGVRIVTVPAALLTVSAAAAEVVLPLSSVMTTV